MTTPIVNDVSPRNQFVALQDSTIFMYDFLVLVDSDLDVFRTPVGQAASSADILQLTVDYNVDSVGDSNGGNVILTSPANAGDIITIERNSPIQRPTNFNPGDFTVEEMNDSLNAQTTFSQDNEVVAEKLTPAYTTSAIVEPGQVLLPQLGANEFWLGTLGGDAIRTAKLSEAPDCASLRADLAVEAEFADGARLVGYFDDTPAGVGPTTVRDALSRVIAAVIVPPEFQVSANNNIVLGGDFSTNPFQEGISFNASDIGLSRYIADGWGVQVTSTIRASTKKDLNDPVPISLSKVFSDASLEITNEIPKAVLAANDRAVLDQPIEGYYFRKIAERAFSLSFYVRSPIVGTYCVALISTAGDRSIVKEYTIVNANTWEKQTLDFPASVASAPSWGDFKTDRAVTLHFTLAAGTDFHQTADTWQNNGIKFSTANQINFFASAASSTFNINLIQVEPTKVTPFQMRSQEEEIAFAQRYFEKSYNIDVIPSTATQTGMQIYIVTAVAAQTDTNMAGLQKGFITRKRIIPGITWFSPVTGASDRINLFGFGDVVATPNQEGESTTGTVNTVAIALGDTVDGHFVANARMTL